MCCILVLIPLYGAVHRGEGINQVTTHKKTDGVIICWHFSSPCWKVMKSDRGLF